MPEVDRPDNIILIGTTPRTSFKNDKNGDYDLLRYDFCPSSRSTAESASDGSLSKVEESPSLPLDRRDLLEKISIIVLNSYTMDENGKELDDLNFPIIVDASNDMIGKVAKLVKGVKLGTLETTGKLDSMIASLKANTRWPTSALAKLILRIHSLVDGLNQSLPDTTTAIKEAFEDWTLPFLKRIDDFLSDFCSTMHDAKREDLVDVIGSLGTFAIELGSLATGAEELIAEMLFERSGLNANSNSQASKELQPFHPPESGDRTPPASSAPPARSPNPPAQQPKATRSAPHVAAQSLGGSSIRFQSPPVPVFGSLFPPDGQQSVGSSSTNGFTRSVSSPPTGVDSEAKNGIGYL
ncbi:hypothetical protein MD484_g3163, partial [Candolleomyces efflorescens]